MDMAVILQIEKNTASQVAKELYDHGFIHISEWRTNAKNGGNKVYKFGIGVDAVRPTSNWKPRATAAVVPRGPFVPRMDVAAAWLRNPI
jgi:hypothetical protein